MSFCLCVRGELRRVSVLEAQSVRRIKYNTNRVLYFIVRQLMMMIVVALLLMFMVTLVVFI